MSDKEGMVFMCRPHPEDDGLEDSAIADACLAAAHESIEELEAALAGTDARVAALESILRDLDDEDQLQCQAPSWLENGDYYPCDACSCCKAKALVRKL